MLPHSQARGGGYHAEDRDDCAGSIVFCKTLLNDLLATGAEGGSSPLMNRTAPKLEKMAAFAQAMVEENGCDATITATTNRREALAGADYVINMIQVGGVDAFAIDYRSR